MITEETVFVLGAGASKPYGYPTGNELRKKIHSNLLQDLIKSGNEFDEAYISNFMNLFGNSNSSIDKFLSNNNDFDYIGKYAIIYYILQSELKSFYPYQLQRHNQDWFGYLFTELTNNLPGQNRLEEFLNNNITFITFNYDRSLEEFFFKSLNGLFTKIPPKNVAYTVKKLPILHIYGKIADLPLQNTTRYLPYKMDINKINNFDVLIENIKVINEEREIDEDIIKSRELIKKATKVFFLGFGFAKENMKILGIPDIITNRNKQIYGTAKGFTPNEIDSVKSFFKTPKNERLHNVFIEDYDSKMLLRNYL